MQSVAGQRLHLRLFLEGIEVPVISASVQIGINSPVAASIQVVASDRVLEFRARTMVHLFFWDHMLDLPRVSQDMAINIPEDLGDGELKGYKLLFCGEIVGLAMNKTPMGRSAVLQCSDFSTYWDTTYQIFMSYASGGFLFDKSSMWGGSSSMFSDLLSGHASVLNEYIQGRKPKTEGLQNMKGLMAGIVSLLEAMGGVTNHIRGVNDFFTIAECKNHILQQIAAEQNDDTAQQLFDNKHFMEWITRGVGSLGELVTFRDMIKLMFQYIYYEVVPNPSAMFIRGTKSQTTEKTVQVKVGGISEDIISAITHELASATAARNRPLSPEFADQSVATNMASNVKNLLKRVPLDVRQLLEQAIRIMGNIIELGHKKYDPDKIIEKTAALAKGYNIFNVEAYNTSQKLNWGQVVANLNAALEVATGKDWKTVSRKRKETIRGELDQLPTQVFRPDCFFAPPPRCNVLFPEQYTQFSYNRQFLQEVTRLRLTVGWMGNPSGDGLLGNIHYAPSLKEIRDISRKQEAEGLRALLPWEIYSGILPKFEHISEINFISNKRDRNLHEKVKGQAASYSQRSANFNYFKYRFAARSCEISAQFNPFLLCGWPALVISQPFIVDPDKVMSAFQDAQAEGRIQKFDDLDIYGRVELLANQLGAPTHYLGMIQGVSHSVDQKGGATNISLTHARSHRISEDDFLKSFHSEVVTGAKITKSVSTELDAEKLLRSGDYSKLKWLLQATPQDIPEQMRAMEAEKDQLIEEHFGEGQDSVELPKRPTGMPDLTSASPFLLFELPVFGQNALVTSQLYPESSTELHGLGSLRGKTKKGVLKDTRADILEPDGKMELRVGKKGPKGGKVTQIELWGDAILAVVGADLNKISIKTKTVVEEVYVDEFGHEHDPDHFVPAQDQENQETQQSMLAVSAQQSMLPNYSRAHKVKVGKRYDKIKTFYVWRKAIIHEEVQIIDKSPHRIPVEEAIRPPWFSPLYSNFFIGQEVYNKFYGTGSIVDEALYVSPQGSGVFGASKKGHKEILARLDSAAGNMKEIRDILQSVQTEQLFEVPDIETSVDALAYSYGEVRRMNMDVFRFVADYTRRPIATLDEMLGSMDLEYERVGNKLSVHSGVPGFHSSAIAPFGELVGLVDNPDQGLPRLKLTGERAPLDRNLDPRPGRREKVLDYTDELLAGRGSLGVGLPG